MLTEGVDAVDAPAGLWLSVSEIARQKGVSKQAVAKKVDRLVSLDLLTFRTGPQNAKLVNLAAFDKAVGETTDAIRAGNGGQAASATATTQTDPVLAREQARRVSYEADLAQLKLQERLGALLPIEDVRAGYQHFAEVILARIEKLSARAEDIAAAVAADGTHGVRNALKGIVVDLRKAINSDLIKAETLAPQEDAA